METVVADIMKDGKTILHRGYVTIEEDIVGHLRRIRGHVTLPDDVYLQAGEEYVLKTADGRSANILVKRGAFSSDAPAQVAFHVNGPLKRA